MGLLKLINQTFRNELCETFGLFIRWNVPPGSQFVQSKCQGQIGTAHTKCSIPLPNRLNRLSISTIFTLFEIGIFVFSFVCLCAFVCVELVRFVSVPISLSRSRSRSFNFKLLQFQLILRLSWIHWSSIRIPHENSIPNFWWCIING